MSVVKLQVPIDKNLRERSLKRAKRLGFNSLQDLTRVLLAGFADERQINFDDDSWGEPTPEAAARINKAADEAKRGINVSKQFKSIEEMMAHLDAL